jgi:hypothetical protein
MKLTDKGLKKLHEIERFFCFTMKLNEERTISSLASDETRESFIHFVKHFNRRGMGFLGGFQISLSDDEKTLRKTAATYITPNQVEDGDYVVDVERYKNPDGLPYTGIDKVKKCLEYGN